MRLRDLVLQHTELHGVPEDKLTLESIDELESNYREHEGNSLRFSIELTFDDLGKVVGVYYSHSYKGDKMRIAGGKGASFGSGILYEQKS